MNDTPAQNVLKITGVLLLFLIAVNLLILDIKVFSTPTYTATSTATQISLPAPTYLAPSSQPTTQNTTTPTTYNPPPTASSPREYFIPLGGDTTSSTSYIDLLTTDTLLDTTTYGKIKEAFFIAALSNPTQNGFVQAQLFNVTDKHPVWGSQITSNEKATQTITSNSVTLGEGPKLYRIQLKSSLGYSVSIANAKIKIIAQ